MSCGGWNCGARYRQAMPIGRRILNALDLRTHPFAPHAERVWALRHNLTAYDAWYVAVAEALDCPLATLDRRLSRASGPACEVLTPL